MGDIAISSAVRENLSSLQSTADLLSRTNNRLSTGLKVSSPIDNPTSFFTAQGLNNRAADLGTLQDNIGLAVETLSAAASGIDSLQTLVEQARSTANSALNTKVAANDFSATAAIADPTTALSAFANAASTEAITITVDGAATTITANALTVSKFVSALNGISGLTAKISGTALALSATNGRSVEVSSSGSGGSLASDIGFAGTFDNGTNRDSFVTDYNNLLDQIDQLSDDASFNGVNLLDGNDLTAKFNEDGSSSLTISGVTFDAAGLGLTDSTTSAFGSDAGINAVVATLDSATNSLRSQSSTFGNNLAVVENRQTFTDSLIGVLERGAGGLTLADTNVEGANLLALQTRQSLGTTALSLSSQSDQAVLQFIR
jgi:flagellin-like hook-associated protein FlgL